MSESRPIWQATRGEVPSPPVYANHFGLKQEPFSIAPDPRYLYMTERHREALAHLLYGLHGTGGVVLLTGEIGAGKTTVCRCFLEQVPRKCNVAYIFNPKLTVTELLRTVCDEFGIPRGHIAVAEGTVKDYVDAINQYLLRTHAVGQNNVLIIDEAQNLSADVLEQLRLLTNLETTERKLLQIILIGQPELREMLARPELEQLAQRITARYHLSSLNERETVQYMRHRLQVAGRHGGMPFDGPARQRIHDISRGVPRRINLLCDRALLGAYARGSQRVTASMVEHAALEVFGPSARSIGWQAFRRDPAAWLQQKKPLLKRQAPWLGAGALAASLAMGVGLWVTRPGDVRTVPDQQVGAGAGPKPIAHAAPALIPPASAQSNAPSGAAPANFPLLALKPMRDETQAWRLLALTAKITLEEGDPCTAAFKLRLTCVKRTDGNLPLLQRLPGPALLILRDEQGQAGYVVFTGATDNRAVLLRGEGGEIVRLDLLWLATQWRGEYATFKSSSPTSAAGASSSGGPALLKHLANAQLAKAATAHVLHP